MATVAFAGDWHGDTFWSKNVIRNLAQMGVKTIYHAGDFGHFGDYGAKFLRKTQFALEKHNMEIWVTPGNHEQWDRLTEKFDANPGQPVHITKDSNRIFWLPKGYRWEDQGVSFVSLGGAPSVNRQYIQKSKFWFKEEALTHADVLRASMAGYADIMITHDTPSPGVKVVEEIVNSKSTWAPIDLMYSAFGRELMTVAWTAIAPRLLVHGHYHVFGHRHVHDGPYTKSIISLANEHQVHGGNILILDLEEFKNKEFKPDVPEMPVVWEGLGK